MEQRTADFLDKVVLITGATSGIGKAIAVAMGAHGAHVLVSGRNAGQGKMVVDTICDDGGTAQFLPADLGSAASARQLAQHAIAARGHVDILVNNAAMAVFGSTQDASENDFDQIYALNVKVPYFLVAALAPAMLARGSGVIVNVSTMVASFGSAASGIYASSKAALNHLTKVWAAELGPKGIRVNAVAPGPTRTEGAQRQLGTALDRLAAQSPLGRVAAPEEIAHTIVFLASDRAAMVHGQLLHVDGGRTAI